MLTEQFINLSCVILLDDNPIVSRGVVGDIGFILNNYDEEDVALQFRKKYELVKCILKLKIDGKNSDQILDSITATGHYSELDSFIKGISERKLDIPKLESTVELIAKRKQFAVLMQDLPSVEEFVKKVNNNAFTDIDEEIQYWSQLISKLHTRIMETKRKESRVAIKELDIMLDSFEPVLNQIERNYSGENVISTGYKELDGYMGGGFQATRLYIFGGTSGDGKSTLLINLLKNAVETNKNLTGPVNLFSYFSLENLMDESLIRLYCAITNQKGADFTLKFNELKPTIQATIKDWARSFNSSISMAYFPGTLTSTADLVSFNEIAKQRYKEKTSEGCLLRATYADYLDLLKSGQTFDLHRMELGQVTIDMKVAAVMGNIPWITVSALNRGAYNDKEEASLANMGESIKKVEHSDFVGIIKNKVEDKDPRDMQIRPEVGNFTINIGKNRNGPKNVLVKMYSNFSKFRIYDDAMKDVNPPILLPREEQSSLAVL